jgi:hypothetical protein
MKSKTAVIVLCFLSFFAMAQGGVSEMELAAPHHQADFTQVIANGFHKVAWARGHLAAFGVGLVREPVTLYDRDGKWLFETPFTLDHAFQNYIQDAAVTDSGTVVVAGSVLTADGASADVIAEVTKSGIGRVIRTSPFYPEKICVAGNGSVWAYGLEFNDDRFGERRKHYPMLREYRMGVGELRSTLDRATVQPPKGVPETGTQEEFQMRCNDTKVVLISGATKELIEYDLSDSRLSRWPLPPLPGGIDFVRIKGAALTDSGAVYVSTYDANRSDALTRILRLQRDSTGVTGWTTMTAVSSDHGRFFILLGSDGESLVYARGRQSPTLFWSNLSLATKSATEQESTRPRQAAMPTQARQSTM